MPIDNLTFAFSSNGDPFIFMTSRDVAYVPTAQGRRLDTELARP